MSKDEKHIETIMNENEQYIETIIHKLDTIHDVELRKLILRLIDEREYLATTIKIDPLTGLYNRRILDHIRRCDAAVMIDIDNFKTINDTFGHDMGDTVIQRVAQLLKLNTRISDYVCRMGGDEFLILFTDCDESIVRLRVEKISKQVTETITLPNVPVTLSVGIATTDETTKVEEMITLADQALYDSKNNGKNRTTFYVKKLQKPNM